MANVSQAAIEAARSRYGAFTDERLAEEVADLQAHLDALDLEKVPEHRSLHTSTSIALEGARAEQKRRKS
jgi:hypothetical protein